MLRRTRKTEGHVQDKGSRESRLYDLLLRTRTLRPHGPVCKVTNKKIRNQKHIFHLCKTRIRLEEILAQIRIPILFTFFRLAPSLVQNHKGQRIFAILEFINRSSTRLQFSVVTFWWLDQLLRSQTRDSGLGLGLQLKQFLSESQWQPFFISFYR